MNSYSKGRSSGIQTSGRSSPDANYRVRRLADFELAPAASTSTARNARSPAVRPGFCDWTVTSLRRRHAPESNAGRQRSLQTGPFPGENRIDSPLFAPPVCRRIPGVRQRLPGQFPGSRGHCVRLGEPSDPVRVHSKCGRTAERPVRLPAGAPCASQERRARYSCAQRPDSSGRFFSNRLIPGKRSRSAPGRFPQTNSRTSRLGPKQS